ncbi:hypothetical protein IKT18_01910 [Candidatus Saccharibacteria bacterium]|nr:hypothetical protein [Candidatus Saccharibacteria bacterium]
MVKRTFSLIFKNWKLFLPLLSLAFLIGLLAIGVNEESLMIINVFIVIMLWLTSIFFVRRILKKKPVRFRDGIFNAMTPFFSSLVILIVIAIQCIPIMIVIIAYSAAVETNLFGDMFYGSLFVLFALAMSALSLYLISGSLMAMVAVSAPGMYPLRALELIHEVMVGERIGFIVKLITMVLVLALIWVAVVGIGVLIELGLRNLGQYVPVTTATIFICGCFSTIYVAVYLYLYYHKILKIKD